LVVGMTTILQHVTEGYGTAVGALVSPAFGLISALRRARTFHPRGDLFVGHLHVDPAAQADDAVLGRRLQGEVLLRFSDALSKQGPRRFDVLGMALRFGRGVAGFDGDQDLLFATIQRPWTMPIAPVLTDTSDYVGNDYFAVSPFATPEHERAYFRVHPEVSGVWGRDDGAPALPAHEMRRERIIALAEGSDLELELGISKGPWGRFRPLGRMTIDRALPRDPVALSFDPFRSGAGIRPRGLVHALRRGVYAASRTTRGWTAAADEGATRAD